MSITTDHEAQSFRVPWEWVQAATLCLADGLPVFLPTVEGVWRVVVTGVPHKEHPDTLTFRRIDFQAWLERDLSWQELVLKEMNGNG